MVVNWECDQQLHFKDTVIRNTLLQVINSLILDFFGSEHVLF